MSLDHLSSGETVNLAKVMNDAPDHHSRALVKTDRFECMVVQMAKGQTMEEHNVDGPLTIQGLTGRVQLDVRGEQTTLNPNDWMFLEGGVPHAVQASEDSSFLLTIFFVE